MLVVFTMRYSFLDPTWAVSVVDFVLFLVAKSEALWIAWRMRRYVPHRHKLPFIAVSISLSEGFGVFASNAAADII